MNDRDTPDTSTEDGTGHAEAASPALLHDLPFEGPRWDPLGQEAEEVADAPPADEESDALSLPPPADDYGWPLRFGRQEATILLVAALLLALVHYHGAQMWLEPRKQLFGWFAVNVLLLLGVPALLIHFVFRQRLSDYGFCIGRADIWGKYLLVFLVVFIPISAITSRLPQFNGYYPRYFYMRADHWLLIPSMLGWAAYFFAWEFFHRGFLLMGLGRRLGPIAIFIQTVPFAMTHFPKPELETYAAITAGVALGLMAWRGKSFLGPWLVHWIAATSMDVFVVFWPLR